MLTSDLEDEVFRELAAQCKAHGSEAIAVNGMPDHVHILIRVSPSATIAGLVRAMKSSTSNRLGKEFRWQGGYGVRSVDPARVPDVITSIREQKDHHRRGEILGDLEERPVHGEASE